MPEQSIFQLIDGWKSHIAGGPRPVLATAPVCTSAFFQICRDQTLWPSEYTHRPAWECKLPLLADFLTEINERIRELRHPDWQVEPLGRLTYEIGDFDDYLRYVQKAPLLGAPVVLYAHASGDRDNYYYIYHGGYHCRIDIPDEDLLDRLALTTIRLFSGSSRARDASVYKPEYRDLVQRYFEEFNRDSDDDMVPGRCWNV